MAPKEKIDRGALAAVALGVVLAAGWGEFAGNPPVEDPAINPEGSGSTTIVYLPEQQPAPYKLPIDNIAPTGDIYLGTPEINVMATMTGRDVPIPKPVE